MFVISPLAIASETSVSISPKHLLHTSLLALAIDIENIATGETNPVNHGEPWTPNDDNRLSKLLLKATAIEEIAILMGRSITSINLHINPAIERDDKNNRDYSSTSKSKILPRRLIFQKIKMPNGRKQKINCCWVPPSPE